MVQTITIDSSGDVNINTGTYSMQEPSSLGSVALDNKLNAILTAMGSAGMTQLHAENDTYRKFEHSVVGGEVIASAFGTTISEADFTWITNTVDAEILALEQDDPA